MLDIKLFRETPDVVRKDLEKRQMKDRLKEVDEIIALDLKHRDLLQEAETLRKARNDITKEINTLRKAGEDFKPKLEDAKKIPKRIQEIEQEKIANKEKLDGILMRMPNILHDSVPVGADEEGNVTEREVGKKTTHDFEAFSHVDLLEKWDLADLERAAKTSGARFYFLKNELVQLDLALQQFAIEYLAKKGFTLLYTPFMMRRGPYEGVTDLKDFEDVMYKVEDEDLYLIATSEHPMAAMHMDELLEESSLPLKYAGLSTCFRKEAGSHGKDTKGIFRVHQFNKIEQFVFCKPEDSWKIHEELLANAEHLFKELELPYRVVNICTGDIGTVAAKKLDIEVWMPVQGKYREVVSCSNCTDYQANRLKTRYRGKEKNPAVHTLNSTAIATSRAMVAILENCQQKDGTIKIPKALLPYMGGGKTIGKA
ncbi:MAG: serine--tRNA ligase [archaeon]